MEYASLSRSSRVKRGFDRIAIAGAAIAAVCSIYWGFKWWGDTRADLFIHIKDDYAFIPDGPTPIIASKLVARFGAPASPPMPQEIKNALPADVRGPYGLEINIARGNKAATIHSSRDGAISIAFLGALWAGVVLLFSWLIRGFMA